MRWLAFILVFVVLFSGLVSADASITCTDGTEITLNEDPYLSMRAVQENKQTFEDCTLTVGDETNFGPVKISTVKGSNAIEIETMEDSSGTLGGYDLEFSEGTDITFNDNGIVVEMNKDEEVAFDTPVSVTVTAEKKTSFAFDTIILNEGRDQIKSLSLNIEEDIVLDVLDRIDLIVNDYYFLFGIGDTRVSGVTMGSGKDATSEYETGTDNLIYEFFKNADQDLVVTMNPQDICSDNTAQPYYLKFGAINEGNKADTFFNLVNTDDERSCNMELFLQSERGALNTDFVIKPNKDEEMFTFSIPYEEVYKNYKFNLNDEDLLTVTSSEESEIGYKGKIDFTDNEDSKSVPITTCTYSYYYHAQDKKHLTDKTVFEFDFFGGDFQDLDFSYCSMENMEYYGSPYVFDEIRLRCPGSDCYFDIDPFLALDAIQGFAYSNPGSAEDEESLGTWTCGGKNCLGQANVKFYPFGDGYFPFIPYKSPNNEFEYYDIDEQKWGSSKYYMGEDKEVLVIPTTGESTFTEKSFSSGNTYSLSTIDGGKIRNKARTRTIELVDGGVYELYYTEARGLVGINCCPGENFAMEDLETFQIGLDKQDSLNTFGCVSTKSKNTFKPNDANSLRYLKFESPGSAEECERKQITEEEKEETEEGDETGEGDVEDVEDELNSCADKGGSWSCQCGKRSALDPDKSCVDTSDSGLWSSSECENDPNCEIGMCEGNVDSSFYCCDDSAANKRPKADRDGSRFAFDKNLECKDGTGGTTNNACCNDLIGEEQLTNRFYLYKIDSKVGDYYLSKNKVVELVDYESSIPTGSELLEGVCQDPSKEVYCTNVNDLIYGGGETVTCGSCNLNSRTNYYPCWIAPQSRSAEIYYLITESDCSSYAYPDESLFPFVPGPGSSYTQADAQTWCGNAPLYCPGEENDFKRAAGIEVEGDIDLELTSLSLGGLISRVTVVKGQEEDLDFSLSWRNNGESEVQTNYEISYFLDNSDDGLYAYTVSGDERESGSINTASDGKLYGLYKSLFEDLSVGEHTFMASVDHDNVVGDIKTGNNVGIIKIDVVEEEAEDILDMIIITTSLYGKYNDVELRFPILYTNGVLEKGSFCKITSYEDEEKFNSLDSEVQQNLLKMFNVQIKEELYDRDYITYSGLCRVKVLATEPSENPEIKFSCSSSDSYSCNTGLSCQEYKRTGGGVTFNIVDGSTEHTIKKDYPDLIAWGYDPYIYTCQ